MREQFVWHATRSQAGTRPDGRHPISRLASRDDLGVRVPDRATTADRREAMVKDQLFDRPDQRLYESFEFNAEVARVFDDMVCRSVPCYDVIQSLLADLALRC